VCNALLDQQKVEEAEEQAKADRAAQAALKK